MSNPETIDNVSNPTFLTHFPTRKPDMHEWSSLTIFSLMISQVHRNQTLHKEQRAITQQHSGNDSNLHRLNGQSTRRAKSWGGWDLHALSSLRYTLGRNIRKHASNVSHEKLASFACLATAAGKFVELSWREESMTFFVLLLLGSAASLVWAYSRHRDWI